MKIIKIEVESCEGCLNHEEYDRYPVEDIHYCIKNSDETINDITTIPDWCELEDAPINADENCYYQGGHGCGNIRMDVPWKEMVIAIPRKTEDASSINAKNQYLPIEPKEVGEESDETL